MTDAQRSRTSQGITTRGVWSRSRWGACGYETWFIAIQRPETRERDCRPFSIPSRAGPGGDPRRARRNASIPCDNVTQESASDGH